MASWRSAGACGPSARIRAEQWEATCCEIYTFVVRVSGVRTVLEMESELGGTCAGFGVGRGISAESTGIVVVREVEGILERTVFRHPLN